ncbi:pectate lyase, partial [Actinomadura kijaniata]|uniref:pectate lyase n=1 Tax=Actinomadura kijaniata TaxID=46161 RepID=UPI00082B52FC
TRQVSAPMPAAAAAPAAPVKAAAWPKPRGERAVGKTIRVTGTFDGRLRRHHGVGDLGEKGQAEGQKPIFELADGAVLKNVVLGAPAADGVHCEGSCAIQNVWWEDVGEDAATFKGGANAVYTVHGGGAREAADKIFQFNGGGKLVISRFQAARFGKVARSCGTCEPRRRTIILRDVTVTAPGLAIVGVNVDNGDTAALRNITVLNDPRRKLHVCERYRTGKGEPKRIGVGPDGEHCRYGASDVTYR